MIYYKIIDVNRREDPWLTMVHGFTHNHHYFSAQILAFQNYFRIFLVDLRGHGRSSALAGPFGIEENYSDLQQALDDAGIEKTHYWGTHTSSAIGLQLAHDDADRILSLILEATVLPGFSMPRVVELLDRLKLIAKTKGVNAALNDWLQNADFFSYMWVNPRRCRVKEHRDILFDFAGKPLLCDLLPKEVRPVSDQLNAIQQPVLIYNGKHDLSDLKNVALTLTNNLPSVQQVEIQNSGGYPAWENPQEVNMYVQKFLRRFLDKTKVYL